MEVFYKVPGYGDEYMMSGSDVVKRKARRVIYRTGYVKDVPEKVLRPRPNGNGIMMVDRYEGGKKVTRSLVALRRTVKEF